MINPVMTQFAVIDGVGAASGLVVVDEHLYLVSDFASFLYRYDLNTQRLHKIALVEQAQDIVAKKDKFDLEAMLQKDDSLFLFGSGSTDKRNQLFIYHLPSQTVSAIDLSLLYQQFRQISGLAADELNIEGVIYHAGSWLFFQRGNGLEGQNGIFQVQGEDLAAPAAMEFTAVQLPHIHGVPASFTDAVLIDDRIYFLAAVENSASTYDDGEVLGSFIGCMDVVTKQVLLIRQITDRHKLEGLALYQRQDNKLTLLLCEDQDNDQLQSTIYQITIDQAQIKP